MRADVKRAVKRAEITIHTAYITACDEAGRALDPVDLGLPIWAQDMLAEPFEARLQQDQQRDT